MANLRKFENVYEYAPGIWVAEYMFDGAWEKLGDYTSRCAAVNALIKLR